MVGADTAKRIVDKKYYENDEFLMVAALSEIAALGCTFVVGGRKDGNDFLTIDRILASTRLPQSLKQIFFGISTEEFRLDISSSEIRAAAAADVEKSKGSVA